jgi:hypothetical protein
MCSTPEEFASLLDSEASGREPATRVGAPFVGVPRKPCESELLKPQQLVALALRRSGLTLEQVAREMGLKSRERVRMILMAAARRWEYVHGQRPVEWESWYRK